MVVAGAIGTWKLVKIALGIFGLVLLVSGWVYSNNSRFKAECLGHKTFGYDMGGFENFVCDVNFTISSSN